MKTENHGNKYIPRIGNNRKKVPKSVRRAKNRAAALARRRNRT